MSKTTFGRKYFKTLLIMSRKERIKNFKDAYDVTDIEYRVCDFYYKVTELLQKNMANEWGRGNCKREKELVEDFLCVRRFILDSNFVWTDYYKKQLSELNTKVKDCLSLVYEEAQSQFGVLKKRENANDPFLKGFEISIGIVPITYDFLKENVEKNCNGIFNILCDLIPHMLWSDSIDSLFKDINYQIPNKYENEETYFEKCRNIFSWYDILKITDIYAEVNVTHRHFTNNIGKGVFWDTCIQSLSDNEAENYRQVYMSLLSKNVTGLPAHLFVDEMDCWEKIGPYRRIKFQGNKADKSDFKKLYSMSIEENPRVFVKDAQIDLTDDELRQIKNFVSKNRETLISIAKQDTHLSDFSKTLGHWKE
jgi:hypothetical protein